MTAPMPRSVRVSLWLLLISQAAIMAVGVLDPRPMPAMPPGAGVLLFVVVVLFVVPIIGLVVFFAFRAYRGRNWARWVHAGIFLVGAIAYVPKLIVSFQVVPVVGALNLIFTIVQIASVVMLFIPQSNVWYRGTANVVQAT